MARKSREEREQEALDEVVQLGQFTDENAETIVGLLQDAKIPVRVKVPNKFTRIAFAGDWGTRLYVKRGDRPSARDIAEKVSGPLPGRR